MLNGLDLFSGIGGLSLGLREWVCPIAYCEIDPYARAVLLSRISKDQLFPAPIWDDIRTLVGKPLKHNVDIILGGFPCQDISVAGDGKGLEGERSGLFFEVMRLVDEVKPRFIFLENVPAIRVRGLATVTAEITRRGYDCRWTMLSAAEVGAQHIRKRWWLLAHTSSPGLEGQRPPRRVPQEVSRPGGSSWWATEPSVGRVANGIPQRVDRIRGLGNSVVPLQAKEAFKELMGL